MALSPHPGPPCGGPTLPLQGRVAKRPDYFAPPPAVFSQASPQALDRVRTLRM